MTSLTRTTAQISRATGYYIPVSSIVSVGNTGVIYNEPVVAANGLMSSFSTAAWAKTAAGGGVGSGGAHTSSLLAGAGLLKDMGVTLVSSGRTFRKIQLVYNSTNQSTFGVGGPVGSGVDDGYFTGYIELGFGEGGGAPAPVAAFGR
jgi:hypothetical protein